jgi:hypothetical protein
LCQVHWYSIEEGTLVYLYLFSTCSLGHISTWYLATPQSKRRLRSPGLAFRAGSRIGRWVAACKMFAGHVKTTTSDSVYRGGMSMYFDEPGRCHVGYMTFVGGHSDLQEPCSVILGSSGTRCSIFPLVLVVILATFTNVMLVCVCNRSKRSVA